MARDNKTIGKFRLTGIKRAPAGVPQIEVTFDIDTNGILTVSAKDLDTGRQQSIVITANDRMSESEIQQAINDAAEYAATDHIRRDAIDISGKASSLLARAEQGLKAAGKNIDKQQKKLIKQDIALLSRLLVKNRPANMTEAALNEIRAAYAALEASSSVIIND